jgi:hypothetical protein
MTESPGKLLKKERETRNISLDEISAFTKIKEHHLKSIEEDRYELLPAAIYVKGFLKTYAQYLALDPKNIILQYENYLKSLLPPEPPDLQQKIPPPRKSVRPWFLFSTIFTIILCMGIFISYPGSYPGRPVIEAKPKTIPLPSTSPFTGIQGELAVQKIYPVQQKEVPGLKKLEIQDVPTHEAPVFEVLEASIGTRIEREGAQQFLLGKCSEFTSNNQRGYFFTRVKTPMAGKISHIWLWEGKEYHRIEMDVKPPAWSVYSYLTFRPQHTGNWKAEVRDRDRLLTSLNFTVVQSGEERSL